MFSWPRTGSTSVKRAEKSTTASSAYMLSMSSSSPRFQHSKCSLNRSRNSGGSRWAMPSSLSPTGKQVGTGYWAAMSQENIEVVRAVYEEWKNGNFRAGVDLYDPEAVLVQGPGFPESGS